MSKQRTDLVVRAHQTAIDHADAPAPAVQPQRRSPRRRSGGPVIKIRLTAETEEDALRAVGLIEDLLAEAQCRMQRPRVGGNPKYAADPKWLAYGDFDLPAPATKKTKRLARKK